MAGEAQADGSCHLGEGAHLVAPGGVSSPPPTVCKITMYLPDRDPPCVASVSGRYSERLHDSTVRRDDALENERPIVLLLRRHDDHRQAGTVSAKLADLESADRRVGEGVDRVAVVLIIDQVAGEWLYLISDLF